MDTCSIFFCCLLPPLSISSAGRALMMRASRRRGVIHYCFSPLSTNIWESRLWRLFQTKTRAFGANAPSSVAFHIQLKLFKRSQKVKTESKNSKSESGWVLLLQPLSLRNTWSYYCKKIWLDPPVLAPSSSPPLAPSPSLLRPKRSPHLDQVVVLLLLQLTTSKYQHTLIIQATKLF